MSSDVAGSPNNSNDAISRTLSRRKPSGTLYHYTTQSGLIGIIRSRELWATDSQYLNDVKEYAHAFDLAGAVISRRLSLATDHATVRVLKDMKLGLQNAPVPDVYVCSFSEERDSLSQWRAYCSPTSG